MMSFGAETIVIESVHCEGRWVAGKKMIVDAFGGWRIISDFL